MAHLWQRRDLELWPCKRVFSGFGFSIFVSRLIPFKCLSPEYVFISGITHRLRRCSGTKTVCMMEILLNKGKMVGRRRFVIAKHGNIVILYCWHLLWSNFSTKYPVPYSLCIIRCGFTLRRSKSKVIRIFLWHSSVNKSDVKYYKTFPKRRKYYKRAFINFSILKSFESFRSFPEYITCIELPFRGRTAKNWTL